MSKSIIFLVKSFLATFIDIWRFFSGHTVHHVPSFFNSLRTAKCTLVQLSEVRIIEIHKFQLSLTFSIFKERKEIHFFSFLLFESSVGRPWSPWVWLECNYDKFLMKRRTAAVEGGPFHKYFRRHWIVLLSLSLCFRIQNIGKRNCDSLIRSKKKRNRGRQRRL